LGINPAGTNTRPKVFPNPATDFLNVQFPESGEYQIAVYNLEGKEVIRLKSTEIPELKIDLRRLNSGIHILNITGNMVNESVTFEIER
jgi:hypothetical protein